MANEEHLQILEQGVKAWNQWREENPEIRPDLIEANLPKADLEEANLSRADLSGANLNGVDLSGANLSKADLSGASLLEEVNLSMANLSEANLSGAYLSWAYLFAANLSGANLSRADLSGAYFSRFGLSRTTIFDDIDETDMDLFSANLNRANLSGADLSGAYLISTNLNRANLNEADLRRANLSEADLRRANLISVDLSGANLSGANLNGAKLTRATLVETDLTGTDLTGCSIFGIAAWELKLEGATQTDLIITRHGEPTITVDNLEVAQFIYLLLNNERIRDVIDTITSKVVLILGRFTPERKAVLDAIRDELRKRDYLPVLFDFDKPASRDMTETVRTLAHLARFIIADLTAPRSIPQELQAIVPGLAVPVQPLLLEGSTGEWGMFQDLRKYDWVLEVHRYDSLEDLLASLGDRVIAPAEAKAKELAKR